MFNSLKLSGAQIRSFNQRLFLLKRVGKVLIRERFDIKIAESSKTAIILWKNSNFEIVKVRTDSSKQKYKFLAKPIGRTKAGVKYKNRIFLYSRYYLAR